MKALFSKLGERIVWVYNHMHWFTDKEAWWIYRLGAILEATGWTLLISAIIYRHLGLPQYESVVNVAGRTHGIFFIAYFSSVLATARSMQWGVWRVLLALGLGVPPYMSLIFEQVISWQRKHRPVYVEPPKDIDK